MKFTIYQIKNPTEVDYAFRGFNKDLFSISDYGYVYSKYVDEKNFIGDMDILETLYGIFNIDHPKDYAGRSLSVSDVVQLGNKYYYCDRLGWKDITEYIA